MKETTEYVKKKEKCLALINSTGRYEHRRVSDAGESIKTHSCKQYDNN